MKHFMNKTFVTDSGKLFVRTNLLYACREARSKEVSWMTQNQIRYWELQEQKRSNQIREAETERANRAKETETNRANVEQENLKADIQTSEKKLNNARAVGEAFKAGKTVVDSLATIGSMISGGVQFLQMLTGGV